MEHEAEMGASADQHSQVRADLVSKKGLCEQTERSSCRYQQGSQSPAMGKGQGHGSKAPR